MATLQHGAYRSFALVIFQGRGNAHKVCVALGGKNSGHRPGAARKRGQMRGIPIERLSVEAQQWLGTCLLQAECALQVVGQAICQELGALAQIFIARLNEAQQHLNALLHLTMHFGLQGLAHTPGNRQHQHPQNRSHPDKIGDRQLGAQALAPPKTLADVH